MRKILKKIRKNGQLITILGLLILCTFMGIQAITNANQQKFNLGITSTASTKLEVEMLVGSQFEKIYSSLDPSSVDYSAVYINSIVDNTINLNNNNLPLSNNSLSFKFYNYDTENAVKVYVNQQEKTVLSKATSSNQPSSSSTITISDISQNAFLGTTLLALEFVLAHEVTFVYNDDTTSNQTQIITSGNTLAPPTPTRTGYDFLGWFIDSGCTQAFDTTSLILRDITLYAGWEKCINIYIESFQISGADTSKTNSITVSIHTAPVFYDTNVVENTGPTLTATTYVFNSPSGSTYSPANPKFNLAGNKINKGDFILFSLSINHSYGYAVYSIKDNKTIKENNSL